MRHLVWFRADLRVADNPALFEAMAGSTKVSAVYVDCPRQWQQHGRSAIQRDFLARRLQALAHELAGLGIPFTVLTTDTFEQVPALLTQWIKQRGISALYANRELGVDERKRDKAVQKALSDTVAVRVFNGDCVFKHGSLTTQSGEMYKVFTPFSKAWLTQLRTSGYRLLPVPAAQGKPLTAETLSLRDAFAEGRVSSDEWPVDEEAIADLLSGFTERSLLDYGDRRDYPASSGTSRLSPYLALGALSPNQCLAAIEEQLSSLPLSPGEPGFVWLNEIIWRDFYRHLLVAFPRLSMNRAFKPRTEALRWSDDNTSFTAWCKGETGFPIVDAAMRCLNQTGWMHNRLRMIVAGFLTKDLHHDWRKGEAYFMSRLIDGELAANNGGWQWAAGTGADAAPYFRIFNPTTQGKRFDEQGDFIRQWLPELAKVPAKMIHQPHTWLEQNHPGHTYPLPIVDHSSARLHALAMFDALKDQELA